MKKIVTNFVIIILALSCLMTATAQSTLWTTSSAGGSCSLGNILEFNQQTNAVTDQFNFSFVDGLQYFGGLLQASNGKFYGVSFVGGYNNVGALYEYDNSANTYTKKFDMVTATGSKCTGSLIQASDGKLYGVTTLGGANNKGVLFQYDITTNTYTDKVDLDASSGWGVGNQLIQASDGYLYGTGYFGGTNNAGTLFRYDISSNTFTKLFDMTTATGNGPYGSLIQASNGKIYGTTRFGGANSVGVIFEYNITTNTYTDKIDLASSTGNDPQWNMIQAGDGNLYGTTRAGGTNSNGVIFQYNPTTNTYTDKYNFDNTHGSTPNSLVQTSNGVLYGTTNAGGTSSLGVLFQYNYTTNTYTVEINLNTPGAVNISSSTILATDGKLYGNSSFGGSASSGLIYQYDIGTNTLVTKYSTRRNPDGASPNCSLTQVSSGNLYGITMTGGANNKGVIFQYDVPTHTFTNKLDLTSANGSSAQNKMVLAGDGNLYGMTYGGGANAFGIIYQYNITNNTYTDVHDFVNNTGMLGIGGMVLANNNKLYGMTSFGGANGNGVLFEYDYTTSSYTKKYDLSSSSGNNSQGTMLLASDGKLYGVNKSGGAHTVGTLFSYDVTSNTYTKLYDFDFNNSGGYQPYSSLIQASNGLLYGTTLSGGANGAGIIFQYNITTNTFTSDFDMDDATGRFQTGDIIQAADGYIYGITQVGGAHNSGVIWKFDPTNNAYTDVHDVVFSEAHSPINSGFVEVLNQNTITTGSLATSYCAGASVSVSYTALGTFTGGNTFTAELSDANGSFSSPTTIGTLAATASGTISCVLPGTASGTGYRIRVKASSPAVNGTDNGVNFTINSNPNPTISVTETTGSVANDGIICLGGSASLNAGAFSTYLWSNSASIQTISVSPTTTTAYSVTVTNASGCSAVTNQTITVNTNPSASSSAGTIACYNGNTSITVSATGGTSPYTGTGVYSSLNAATYSYTVTDNNGCKSATTQVLTQPSANTFTTVATNNTACGAGTQGSIAITATGGTGTKVYSKDNGSTYQGASLMSALADGSYPIRTRDANGCTSSASNITIATSPSITYNPTVVNPTPCLTGTNGKITVIASGGSGFFNYSKNGGTTYQSSNVFTLLTHGTYSIRVKDVLGCLSSVASVVVGPACRDEVTTRYDAYSTALFSIYPNPASSEATLVFASNSEENRTLKIVDVLGNTVLNSTVSCTIGDNQVQLNIASLSRGIYLVLLQNNEGMMQQKIVLE